MTTITRPELCTPVNSHVACEVLNSIADGVLVCDGDLSIRFANTAACEVVGVGADRVRGMDALLLVHLDDIPTVHTGLVECLRTPGSVVRREFRIRLRHGRDRRVEAICVNRMSDADIGGLVVTLRDVTERWAAEQALRESEAHNRRLAECAADAILTANIDGTIAEVNAAACALTGFSREELVTMRTYQLYVVADQPLARLAVETLQSGEQLTVRRQLRRRDGSVLPVEVSATRIAGNGLHAIIRDVSAREQVEERARRAQRLEALGLLAASIAHDFNNLLTVVRSNASLLRETLTPTSGETEILAELSDAVERAVVMVRRLGRGSESGEVALASHDMRTIVSGIERTTRSLLPASVRFSSRIEPDLPPVLIDSNAIHECALNIVLNARDAMPLGGTLQMTLARERVGSHTAQHHMWAAAGDFVVLAFRDTGVGMDDATLRRVFEPYFTTKSGNGGTGLGMTAVYRLMKQQMGFVGIESQPGVGTTVSLYLAVATHGD